MREPDCQLIHASLLRNLMASLKPSSHKDCMLLVDGGNRAWFRRLMFSKENWGNTRKYDIWVKTSWKSVMNCDNNREEHKVFNLRKKWIADMENKKQRVSHEVAGIVFTFSSYYTPDNNQTDIQTFKHTAKYSDFICRPGASQYASLFQVVI